ncbi:unnamed protein product [Rotaria sordida]|uniref:RRM domain-containing protein n=1 Tax=Rotaria sordida TaxID=392033 RepID=A0A818VIG8_9BILA|nr:unnamed protein product [Rotaria sordida]
MTKNDLHKVFQKYGSIINIKVIKDKLTGENKDYKPKFAEPLSSKHHCDNEDTLLTPASIYDAISLLYRQKISSTKQYLPLSTCSLSNIESKINNERRLIVRCEMTITKYHISKLFDLIPNMEEYSPININIFNEHYFIIRYKSCQYATIINDLINQSQNEDTSRIGQLIHQVAKILHIIPQHSISEDFIRNIFNRFGNLIDVRSINSQLCYIMFSDERSADIAMKTMNGQEIPLIRTRTVESNTSVDSTTISIIHCKRQKA